MDQIVHEVRNQQWAEIIQQCNASGLIRKDFCQQNGINQKSFYYHQKQLRQQVALLKSKQEISQPGKAAPVSFAEVEISSAKAPDFIDTPVETFRPDAVIRTRTLKIELSNGASSDILSLIGALVHDAT